MKKFQERIVANEKTGRKMIWRQKTDSRNKMGTKERRQNYQGQEVPE